MVHVKNNLIRIRYKNNKKESMESSFQLMQSKAFRSPKALRSLIYDFRTHLFLANFMLKKTISLNAIF